MISLQGELGAFGIDDVLALVATKVGVLELRKGDRVAQVHIDAGEVVAADDGRSTDVVDVLSGLLRWQTGSFAFVDGERPPVEVTGRPIAEVLSAARAVLADWLDVEAVIPSPHASLALAPEAPSIDVHLAPSEWVAIAAVGGGATAGDAAARVGNSMLFGMQVLKALAERGLLVVGAEVDGPERLTVPADRATLDLRDPKPTPSEPEAPANRRGDDQRGDETDTDRAATAEPVDEPAAIVDASPLPAPTGDEPDEDRRHLLGLGNGPLLPDAPDDGRALPELHSIEAFPQASSPVESLARVLDAVQDGADEDGEPASGADDDRVALLKELEALRDGIRSTGSPALSSRPAEQPASPVPAEGRRGRRS